MWFVPLFLSRWAALPHADAQCHSHMLGGTLCKLSAHPNVETKSVVCESSVALNTFIPCAAEPENVKGTLPFAEVGRCVSRIRDWQSQREQCHRHDIGEELVSKLLSTKRANNLLTSKWLNVRAEVIHEPIGDIFLDIGYDRPVGHFWLEIRAREHVKRRSD